MIISEHAAAYNYHTQERSKKLSLIEQKKITRMPRSYKSASKC
jgi:hypothetical protein